jgi:hypothetical protein
MKWKHWYWESLERKPNIPYWRVQNGGSFASFTDYAINLTVRKSVANGDDPADLSTAGPCGKFTRRLS